jgi:hypothetical protein
MNLCPTRGRACRIKLSPLTHHFCLGLQSLQFFDEQTMDMTKVSGHDHGGVSGDKSGHDCHGRDNQIEIIRVGNRDTLSGRGVRISPVTPMAGMMGLFMLW